MSDVHIVPLGHTIYDRQVSRPRADPAGSRCADTRRSSVMADGNLMAQTQRAYQWLTIWLCRRDLVSVCSEASAEGPAIVPV